MHSSCGTRRGQIRNSKRRKVDIHLPNRFIGASDSRISAMAVK